MELDADASLRITREALRPATWERSRRARLAAYTELAEDAAPVLAGLPVRDVPALAEDPSPLAAVEA